MSLKDDLAEAKELWANGSWMLRLFVVLSVVLTTSSVASLSDIVFEWKGFILDGINFYRSTVGLLFERVKLYLGLEYSRENADVLVAVTIMNMGWLRFIWSDWKSEKLSSILSNLSITLIVICGEMYLWYVFNGLDQLGINLWFLAVGVLSFLAWPFMTHFTPKEKLILWGPVVAALVIVSVFGAINAGLSKGAK